MPNEVVCVHTAHHQRNKSSQQPIDQSTQTHQLHTLSRTRIAAPWSTNHTAIKTWPSSHAEWRGVLPSCSSSNKQVILTINNSMLIISPRLVAANQFLLAPIVEHIQASCSDMRNEARSSLDKNHEFFFLFSLFGNLRISIFAASKSTHIKQIHSKK
jgi:hypothetical protein